MEKLWGGSLDGLVNNVGTNVRKPIHEDCAHLQIAVSAFGPMSLQRFSTFGFGVPLQAFGFLELTRKATEAEYYNMMRTNLDSCWFLCALGAQRQRKG